MKSVWSWNERSVVVLVFFRCVNVGSVYGREDAVWTQSKPRGGDDGHSGTSALSAQKRVSSHLQYHADVLDGGNICSCRQWFTWWLILADADVWMCFPQRADERPTFTEIMQLITDELEDDGPESWAPIGWSDSPIQRSRDELTEARRRSTRVHVTRLHLRVK